MTTDAELVRLELDNQIVGNRAFVTGDPLIAKRYGTSFQTVAGLCCSTSETWDHPLFNRVIGAGILAPLDAAALDAIVAHYAAKGRACHRSEERRVGKECIPPCRSRWSPYH